jgi:hypothetical protein
VVFRGFGGRLRVIFRLKESNIDLDKQLYYRRLAEKGYASCIHTT